MTALIDAALDKRFGLHRVLRSAAITVEPGTVHALVGENGAGKSTLVKILAGVLPGDTGRLAVDGTTIALATWNRVAARRAGIGIVQQHGAFAGTLTVVENAVLGIEPRRGPLLDLDATARALATLGAKIGLAIDPHARTDELSLGAAQRAEIVAALHLGAKLLILDEPTAVLAPVEVDGLLATLRALARSGTTIILVTHKLDEVAAVADAVTVLRAGATVADFRTGTVSRYGAEPPRRGTTSDSGSDERSGTSTPQVEQVETVPVREIARAMVGADLPEPGQVPAPGVGAKPVLVLEHVGVGGALHDVELSVRSGEIVGVAGVDGNGQRELAMAIAGLVAHVGRVRIGAREVTKVSPAKRLAAGLAHVPEDRHHGGVVLDATVEENLALGRADVTGRFRIDRARVAAHADARIAELDIRPPDRDAIVRLMSGGNQQKIVIGRELSRPGLVAVVAAQPTRGVDLGAVARIHDRLRAAATAGAGVLVISADLDELLGLCHRVVVLLRGRIVGERGGAELREARGALGMMMTGAEDAA